MYRVSNVSHYSLNQDDGSKIRREYQNQEKGNKSIVHKQLTTQTNTLSPKQQ